MSQVIAYSTGGESKIFSSPKGGVADRVPGIDGLAAWIVSTFNAHEILETFTTSKK